MCGCTGSGRWNVEGGTAGVVRAAGPRVVCGRKAGVGVTSEAKTMKVQASVKKRCDKCKVVKREGVVRIICENPRHKQRQG